MDLRQDIKNATLLNWADNDAKFFRLQGLSQAAQDRKMNERKVKKPINIELVEEFDEDNDDYIGHVLESKVKPSFDKHGVSAAIREVNGGRDLSNENWQKQYLEHLKDINLEREISQTSEHNNTGARSKNQPETKSLDDKSIKEKHKLFKNAAIMGLITTQKISLQDLIIPYNENTIKEENKLDELQDEAAFGYTIDNKYQVESIPLHEDPDIFVHPLQKGINEKDHEDIDFTLSRVGKKTKVTPQEFYLDTTTDDCFCFVKNKDTT